VNTRDPDWSQENRETDYQLPLRSEVNNNPQWEANSPSQVRDVELTFEYWESKEFYEVRASGPVFDNDHWAGRLVKP
jgi:hypothetical protein